MEKETAVKIEELRIDYHVLRKRFTPRRDTTGKPFGLPPPEGVEEPLPIPKTIAEQDERQPQGTENQAAKGPTRQSAGDDAITELDRPPVAEPAESAGARQEEEATTTVSEAGASTPKVEATAPETTPVVRKQTLPSNQSEQWKRWPPNPDTSRLAPGAVRSAALGRHATACLADNME